MPAKFDNLDSAKGLGELNKHLADQSYIEGYTPSSADFETFNAIKTAPSSSNQHVARWWKHINSFPESERKNWSSSSSTQETKASQQTPAKKEEDDFDLFGEEDPEEEARREAEIERRAKEQAEKKEKERQASGKAKAVLKSAVVLDVKPWEAETDMQKLEELVRTVAMEGLEWKASKLVEIGYGIRKLQISCHIVDEIVSMDDIQEQIQAFEEFVQSTDVVNFTKL